MPNSQSNGYMHKPIERMILHTNTLEKCGPFDLIRWAVSLKIATLGANSWPNRYLHKHKYRWMGPLKKHRLIDTPHWTGQVPALAPKCWHPKQQVNPAAVRKRARGAAVGRRVKWRAGATRFHMFVYIEWLEVVRSGAYSAMTNWSVYLIIIQLMMSQINLFISINSSWPLQMILTFAGSSTTEERCFFAFFTTFSTW